MPYNDRDLRIISIFRKSVCGFYLDSFRSENTLQQKIFQEHRGTDEIK